MSASGSEEDEMASFMGFSTFGKAPALKKRKFNPSTDASIDGEELDARKIDRGGKKGNGSGGNEVPLGRVRSVGGGRAGSGLGAGIGGVGHGMNLPAPVVREEVGERGSGNGNTSGVRTGMNLPPARRVLRASPPREEEGGAMYKDTSLPPPTDTPQYMDTSLPPPSDAPQHMDTSLPPPAYAKTGLPPPKYVDTVVTSRTAHHLPPPELNDMDSADAAEIQLRIDRLMASIQPTAASDYAALSPPPPISTSNLFSSSNPLSSFPPPQYPRQTNVLPTRPPPPPSLQNSNGNAERGRGTASDAGSSISGGRQRGERNAEWYIGYYDPAFNENPWEKLEKEKGLVGWGSWVERPKREVRS